MPLFLFLVGILVFQVTLGVASSRLPAILGYAASIPPEKIVELTNKRRMEQGLSSLVISPELSQAALAKAADMFAKDYWAHVAPDGMEPWKFITDAGYAYIFAGENLARDFTNPDGVVAAWLASPSHKENLLSLRYQEIGVAVVDGDLAGVPTTLVVQMFGTRMAGAPSTSGIATGAAAKVAQTSVAGGLVPSPTPFGAVALVPRGEAGQYVAEEVGTLRQGQGKGEFIGQAQSVGSLASPFDVTRIGAALVLGTLLLVLLLDLAVSRRMKLVRISGRTWAHIAFYGVILVAIWAMRSGRII